MCQAFGGVALVVSGFNIAGAPKSALKNAWNTTSTRR